MVSASLYFHFSMFDLQRSIPVLSLFIHYSVAMEHQILGPGLQMIWILVSVVQTACGGSMLLVVQSRCGSPSVRRYTFSTYVGLRHPGMERQASFRAGSSLHTCFELSHTGHTYSTVEWQSARAFVLMVAGLAPILYLIGS